MSMAGLLVLISWLALMAKESVSIRFDLRSGTSKCIAEDVKAKAMTYGKYTVINPNNEPNPIPHIHRLIVKLSSPSGKSYHHVEQSESGNFAFTAEEGGNYTACFWAPPHNPPVTVTVEFDWRTGVAATDWSNVAKKSQVEIMELELKKLYATVTSIHDEMFLLREREEEMLQFNRTTNSRMATFSFFSLLVCLSVAGLQLWNLKTFFERKKLL